jgi:hypothetical protein
MWDKMWDRLVLTLGKHQQFAGINAACLVPVRATNQLPTLLSLKQPDPRGCANPCPQAAGAAEYEDRVPAYAYTAHAASWAVPPAATVMAQCRVSPATRQALYLALLALCVERIVIARG